MSQSVAKLSRGGFIQVLDRNDRVQLIERPVIGDGFEY